LQLSRQVIPCFIFDKRQIDENDYKSNACLQFMAASLRELDTALQKKNGRLFCFYGIAEDIVAALLSSHDIDAVFVNRDYTPFSRKRDYAIEKICHQQGKAFHCHADALLHEPEACLKSNNEPYTIFTHFFKRAAMLPVNRPAVHRSHNYYQSAIAGSNHEKLDELLKINNPQLAVTGGRQAGLQLIKKISQLADYQDKRNIPSENYTSHLSAHHKFGTISIRETHAAVISAFGRYHTLINELYWRDFFTHIAFHFPRVFGNAFNTKYQTIPWEQSTKLFDAWCNGMTGFPIVDAGMSELNTTCYMHNRVRMITASFLTKDLHVDWRLGEKYFARQLVDYDPAVNNGNWQWSASTGCDAQPYFRIFNPWLQQKKFDPECVYIKHWLPELANLNQFSIHQLADIPSKALMNYPQPIVNHAAESQKSKELFKTI
jgi:deoxyribodipyrimidine photo-lyase